MIKTIIQEKCSPWRNLVVKQTIGKAISVVFEDYFGNLKNLRGDQISNRETYPRRNKFNSGFFLWNFENLEIVKQVMTKPVLEESCYVQTFFFNFENERDSQISNDQIYTTRKMLYLCI